MTVTTIICQRPDCRRPITDPEEAAEKRFVVVATGEVIALRRHDACAEKYAGSLRPAKSEDVRKFLSPSFSRKLALERRRKAKIAKNVPTPFKRVV